MQTSIYINDHTDEICPATLEAWARYFDGDESWGYLGPRPKHGETFAATEVDYHYLPAYRSSDGIYSIPDCPDGMSYHAIAYDEDGGWSATFMPSMQDALLHRLIAEGRSATDEEQRENDHIGLRQILAEFGEDDIEWVVCRSADRDVLVRFLDNPARCEVAPKVGK